MKSASSGQEATSGVNHVYRNPVIHVPSTHLTVRAAETGESMAMRFVTGGLGVLTVTLLFDTLAPNSTTKP